MLRAGNTYNKPLQQITLQSGEPFETKDITRV